MECLSAFTEIRRTSSTTHSKTYICGKEDPHALPKMAKALYANREAIALANVEQLAKLLTALVRRGRFSEGALARAYEDKILLSIVERVQSLLRNIQKNT
jgi:hypothetical protein